MFDSDLESVRRDVREWLAKNFPPWRKGKGTIMFAEGGGPSEPDFPRWKKAMAEKGWGTPTWPKQYGGAALSRTAARVLQEEMNKIRAFSPIGGQGVGMFRPPPLQYGQRGTKPPPRPPRPTCAPRRGT